MHPVEDPRLWTLFLAAAVMVAVLGAGLIIFFRRVMKRPKVLPLGRVLTQISYSVRCPKCRADMSRGFCAAPRGVFWRGENEKTSRFLPVWKALPNTMNTGWSVAENKAWHCERCNIIVIDHSFLITPQKKF